MAETDIQTSSTGGASQAQSPKKDKKAKKPATKPSHPPTAEMVTKAIKELKERGGSSLQAIKKYIAANYKVDTEKVSPFIKKYLKSAVTNGSLVQTKGKGASGSFKLASATSGVSKPVASKKKTVRKSPTKRAASAEKPKVAKKATKKPASEKKVAVAAPTKAKKTAASPKKAAPKPKSPSKAKKSNKAGPTKKPKAPKPKTVKSPSKAKKAAPKKK